MKIWNTLRRFSGNGKKRGARPSGSRNKHREATGSLRGRDLRMEQFEERMLLSISTPSWLSNHPYMSDAVVAAVESVVDLEAYDIEDLDAVGQWVVGLDSANGAVFKADSLGADYVSEAPYLENMSIWEFPSEDNWQTVVDTLTSAEGVDFFYPLVPQDVQTMMIPNDTLFDDQWHLLNTGQLGGTPGEDVNVVPAWDLVLGTGVVLGVIDDGVQVDHPDFIDNFRADVSYDYGQNDTDPSPVWSNDNHGTSVAGVAAAVGDNGLGVSGAAPNVDLAGIRIDYSLMGDWMESQALSHENQVVDIYNNSWGRTRYLDPMGPLSTAAIEDSILNGRGGLGNIYLFAAGNSRMEDGDANYGGEQASRYTIAVAGIGNDGHYAYYSNPGANLLISTQTDGIYTTDRTGEDGYNATGTADTFQDPLPDLDYTSRFNGTSSACPLASGVVALMLEANPNLTYRDVQSILVNTARMNDPAEPDWTTNAAGYHINHNYGFGAIDATAAVNAAMTWQTLSEELSTESGLVPVAQPIPDGGAVGMVSSVTLNDTVTNIEWVEVTVDIDHLWPGDLDIVLTSPDGTESVLAVSSDMWWMFRQNGLKNWTFTSARHWGESSEGEWTLQVRDSILGETGTWNSWSIKAYGEDIANIIPPDPASVVGPELISVKPNSGSAIADGDLLHVGPRELKFTFNEGQVLDEATLNSIKMLRAGGDGVLDNANDVAVDYGWIGLGERPNEVVVRFAETLPDDLYRITIVGAGDEPLMNTNGDIFHKGEDVGITFDLDLGALITAIVPQPTYRDAAGELQQHRDKVVVYFNSDTLDEASAENLDFYRLTLTGQTADTADDVELTPQSVVYDAVANTVELTFSDDLANLGTGAFRLRIGNEWREIVTEAKDAAEIIAENELDVNLVGDTFLAALELGMLGSATEAASLIVSSAIEPQAYDLDWPGAISEIGHRDLPLSRHYSSHYTEWYFANDDQYGIATIAYNFKDHYGDDPAGNPLHNLISEEQKNRAREVFELYGHYLGVQFVETDFSGFTIATGDMRALDPTVDTGPGGIIFKADNDVVIMDAAEDWNESLYGGDETNWFATAMQGIGYLLGLGYADDMDPVTIMGNNNNTMYNGDGQYYSVSNELVYPGNQDIVHGRHIFRPDGNDVDIYKFEIDEAGKFSAETIAERMDGSSLLDSNLKLYDDADNLIAGNDDYYSEDSYVEVYLQPGTYYVAVSSTGNNQYDPRVAGSGIGGTTQGPYDLRVSFTPDVGEHLSDTTGTRFDGDADGVPGGVHNFWFNVQPLAGTIFVDKIADGGAQDGSLANPYTEIDTALAMADADDIVRIVGNYDRAYMDHVEYETGPLSNGLAAGDLNGDGWKDIVTTGRDEEEETNHVSILFGVGDGTFWDPVTYEVGEEPMSVELGDITGDGLLDIIVTNSGENTISLLGNMGDGTFQTLPKRFVGNGPTDLALGDLNGDGDLDIVVANTADDTVSILLSDGNGGFLDQDVHIVGTAPSAVAVGDVDNNQRVDVIVANSEDDTINVLLNEENIHTEETEFEIQAAIDVGVNPSALAAGDLTGDGTVDVVVVNAGGDNISVLSGIAVLSGLGDGTFATPLDYYVVDGDPTDVKLAALDNNSTLDVVVSVDTDTANDKVLVLFTLPDGSLETPVEYGVGDAPGNLVLADLDNDGVVDIATTNTGGDSVSVLLDHRDAAYEIGFDLLGRPLEDGWRMEVPQGVTVMVDAGAVFKLRQANIDVGSSTQGVDRSEGALQVLGTPDLSVYFTSFHNKLMAQDNAGFDVPAAGGDWGGLVLRNKLDYEFNKTAAPGDERTILEEEGIFLNYVNHADITFGGGQVVVNSSSDIYNPLHMVEARPTLTYNTLTGNADAAMSADPNSFADTKFQGDTFTADYDRVGPEIHGNYIVDNSINGIFVRVNTEAGKAMDELQVSARWDDLDIAHVLLENLIISGTPGGPKADAGLVARQDARLAIDPGVLVKLDATRIEAEMGAQLIAEGNDSYPIVFTSLDDDRYGMGGTFDTSNNAGDVTPEPGDWGGIYFAPVSSGSIDNALFAFAGGVTPIEGGFAGFNAVEIHQGVVRITDSVFEYNTSSVAGNDYRNGRNTATDSLIFVRGAQPIIAGNTIWNNDATAISIDANSMTDEQLTDWGRSRGPSEADGDYQNNYGPLVRDNHLANNDLNGMLVRGGTLTTAGVWDDTDIVHILQDEIVIPNHHTFSGLRLQSQADESLVVKLQGTRAGFTALGTPSDIEDRVGGTLQVLGAAGFPVVFTSLADDSQGAGYDPWGNLLTDTDNDSRDPLAGDWRSIKLERYVNDRNVAIVNETEKPAAILDDENSLPVTSQDLGSLAWSEMSGDDNLRLGFDVHGFIRSDDSSDVDVYSFKAQAGVEVWLDIDRTTLGLDTVIELVDANGNVFARSDNSEAERNGEQELYGLARGMDRDVWDIDDQYTTNPHDAGMRVVLPGPAGQTRTFFVRVSSKDGLSSGGYQLQVRLRETQEFSGSYINMSSIHYATNGIEMLGLPTHSPLVGTTSEIDRAGSSSQATTNIHPAADKNDFSVTANNPGPGFNGATVEFVDGNVTGDNATATYNAGTMTLTIDIDPGQTSGATIVAAIIAQGTFTAALIPEGTQANDGSGKINDLGTMGTLSGGTVGGNNDFAGTEYIGNLLYSDQNSLQVSGYMDGAGDIDWYSFNVDLQDIKPDAQIQWPTVFDIDYADGMSRPDLALWVYQADGTLIYASDNSNLFDDLAGPAAGADTDDLDRGSLGPFDPYLGTVLLPEGNDMTYYVAVTTQARVPTALDQVGARLEPITSLGRVAEDHVISNDDIPDPLEITQEESAIPDSPAAYLFNPLILQPHVEEYAINDVTMYVLLGDELVTVDPFTGEMEMDVTGDNMLASGDILSYGDIAMRSDGRLFTFVNEATDGDLDPKMNYQQISTENGSILSSQITGIDTYVKDLLGENAIETDEGTIHYNAMALREAEDPDDRYVYAVGNVSGGGDSGDFKHNLLYKFEPDGTAIQHPEAEDDDPRLPTDFIPLAALRYDDPISGDQISGHITGLAFIEDRLYAVDDVGNFYFILVEPDDDYPLLSLLDTYDFGPRDYDDADPPIAHDIAPTASLKLELISTIDGAMFSGLARGPRNAEGGIYANMLYATTSDGKIYALNEDGGLEPVFNNGETSIDMHGDVDVSMNATGLAFSTLDYNLWHYTDNRTSDSGHGSEAAPDNTRGATPGGSSFWFGLEEHEEGGFSTGIGSADTAGSTVAIPGAIDDPADPNAGNLLDTYNLPGGAHGTLTTGEFSLAGYESRDVPMLYFNYFLETDGNDGYVTDSARVYISPDDISWTMLASNITTTGDVPENATEAEWYITETEYEDTIDERPRVPVETLQDGTGDWHQAVVDLSGYMNVLREHYGADEAGFAQAMSGLRLKFEFSSAGSMNIGQINFLGDNKLREGGYLRAVPGEEIIDGDYFAYFDLNDASIGAIFEFDMGYSLVAASSAGRRINDGDTITIEGRVFEFTKDRLYNSGNDPDFISPIFISDGDSASDVVKNIAKLVNELILADNDFNFPIETHVKDDRVYLYGATTVEISTGGLVIEGDAPGTVADDNVPITISPKMTASAVAAAMGETIDAELATIDSPDYYQTLKVYGDLLQPVGHDVILGANCPLSYSRILPGDNAPGGGPEATQFYSNRRGQENRHEGFYIDDVVVGFAERGQMVTGAAPDTGFNVVPAENAIVTGPYQLEIRTGTDYTDYTNRMFDPDYTDDMANDPTRSFDTNDRMTSSITIEASPAYDLVHGTTFTVNDGVYQQVFQYVAPGLGGVDASALPISFSGTESASRMATKIMQAINDADLLKTKADSNAGGNLVFLADAASVEGIAVKTFDQGGQGASAIEVVDLNDDDFPDVITANELDGTVSVMLGYQYDAIVWTDPVFVEVGGMPSDLAVGDINGDSLPDIVTSNARDGTVSVLLSNGDGLASIADGFSDPTFEEQLVYTVGAAPAAVSLADVDADGLLDIVTANKGDDTVSVLYGNGDGTFDPQVVLDVGGAPMDVAVADLDGNAMPDIVAANSRDNTISVLYEVGQTRFSSQETFAVGGIPVSLAIGDLDADDAPDVVVANRGDGTVTVLMNDGSGAFQPDPDEIRMGAGPVALRMGDLDDDGALDMAVVNLASNMFTVAHGDGSGGFAVTSQVSAGGKSPTCLAFADMGTGVLNVLVASPETQKFYVNVSIGAPYMPRFPAFDIYEYFYGTPNLRYINGDSNEQRDQGQIIIRGNEITDVIGWGIKYDSGVRDGDAANLAHPGSVMPQVEVNEQRLVPGVTIENNLVAAFGSGGILFSGDDNSGDVPTAAVPFGRILNNTIYGGELGNDDPTATGTGIQVDENASPTILNNIISTTSMGISVDGTSQTTVIGANSYQDNVINVSPNMGLGQHDMVLADDAPLFVDASTGNFYPAAGSQVIDSSLDSLQDRPELIAVRDPLGIPESPILAPERDLLGQARADDLTVSPPPGLGSNVFKDRGALDRLDFIGPTALVINPMDNEAGLDSDPADNDVFVVYGDFTEFTLQLVDVAGVGIADATVIAANLAMYADGDVDPLVEGRDYFFSYDANTDQITLVPAMGIWEHGHNYEIVLENSATGIRDIADNPLRGNRLDKSARFMISVGHIDYGDAPDPTYPSLLENDGARHLLIGGYYLGEGVTSETDAQFTLDIDEVPLWNASGDLMDDGVIFGSALLINGTVPLTVTASRNGGYLDAWIDFNDDGDWDDLGEQIFAGQSLAEGENELSIFVPATVVDDDGLNDDVAPNATFARFRYSSNDSGLNPTGEALDGEVEDYQVDVVGSLLDFGDAPGPYPTLLHPSDDSLSGAYHAIIVGGLRLGDAIDDELNGQPNATATGDDIDNLLVDDEDGVIADNWFVPGETTTITVNASDAAWLNAWIDFNRDGDWDDSGEKIPVLAQLAAGDNIIDVPVPADAVEGTTYARFRLSSEQFLDPTGPAPDGEVEDYQFLISPTPYDFGDAPLSYPTMWESGAASLLVEQVGENNDLLLTAAVAGTDFNQVEVLIVNVSAIGDEAFAVFSVVENRLTIDVDPEATTASTVIAAIDDEGTFIGTLDSTSDTGNDGTGLVSELGNFGETDGGFIGNGLSAAYHLLGQGLYLGELVDAENDGQAGPLALGDDENGEADEDGIVFGDLLTGQAGFITVTATYEASFSGSGYLNAWIDFDQDGEWTADEIVVSGLELIEGENELAITIPGDAEKGMTFARFRFSTQSDLSFDGMAADGEVEDYQIEILGGNAVISGFKFNDRDYDSRWDANEPGIPGMTIYIDLNENGVLDTDTFGKPIEPVAVTMRDDLSTLEDETGKYEFSGLMGRQDPYILREVVQDGMARLLIEPDGLNNDIQLIAARPGEDLNDIEVQFVDGVADGDEATVVYDSSAKLLTIDIDPAATTANTVIAAINAEGTLEAQRSKINEPSNDGSGLVDTLGSMGATADGSNDAWEQTYPNGTVTLPEGSFGNDDGSYTISLSEAETLTDVNFGNFHLPVLFLSDIKVAEGDAGYTDLEVTVHLQNSFGDTISVDYWTEDGTAIAALPDLDYQEAAGDLTFPAQPAPETPWEQEILNKGFSQGGNFHVSGDYVVWQGRDRDTDDWDIYLFGGTYDANDDPIITQLTDNDTDDTDPFVVQTDDGVHVVWLHRDDLIDGEDTEIYFYDGTQTGGGLPNVVPLTDNAYDDRNPQASDSIIAWWAAEGMLLDSEIFLYEIGSGDPLATTINLSDNEENDSNPQVSGDYVVWTGMRFGASEIILFDGTYSDVGNMPNVQQVTSNGMADSEPQIDGETIVWQRQHVDGNINSYEVYMSEFDPGNTIGFPVRLTNNSVPDLYPQISGDDVVWQAKDTEPPEDDPEGDPENDWEIMHYNTIAQTPPVNITNNSTYDQRPRISGTRVVWQGFDVADWDVFTYELYGEALVQNVSQNDDADWYPEVSGSMIVWQSSGDEDVLIIARAGTPELTQTIPIRIVGDMNLEDDESFFLKAMAASSDSTFIIVGDTAEITILNDDGALDYGDAIDFGDDAINPYYPTLVARDGARHLIDGTIYLGDASASSTGIPDSEDDGLPSEDADGDDLLTGDDEKGVVFDTEIQPGGMAQITITAAADCILNSWIDLNRDGDWDDTWGEVEEQMFINEPLVAGENILTFPVHDGAALGHTYARFRVSSYADIGYTGYVDNGEVEDYRVEITSPDAPPTSSSSAPQGSDADDTIEFIAGDVPQVIVNGVLHELTDAAGEIILDAGLGYDTIILRGSQDDETFALWTDHGTFQTDAYSLRVIASESITAISGGGDDLVDLHDSAGADTFTTTFSSALMSGDGYQLEATGFATVHGHATPGATDKAVMYDSTSSDTGVVSPTYAKLYNGSIYTEANGFEQVRMVADSGGYDIVTMLDSAGKETLQTGQTYAKMIGDDFYNRVELFDRVTARSQGGGDSAQMLDSKGDDTFYASPTLATMRGDGYYIKVEDFAEVTGYGNVGGFDTATLEGSAGIDSFVANSAYGRLSGQGFSNRAYGFEKVDADGNGGDDTAVLYDSVYGDDLVAADDWVSLSNQELDFEFLARSFASVEATSTSDGDLKDVDQSVDFLFAKGLWEDM